PAPPAPRTAPPATPPGAAPPSAAGPPGPSPAAIRPAHGRAGRAPSASPWGGRLPGRSRGPLAGVDQAPEPAGGVRLPGERAGERRRLRDERGGEAARGGEVRRRELGAIEIADGGLRACAEQRAVRERGNVHLVLVAVFDGRRVRPQRIQEWPADEGEPV